MLATVLAAGSAPAAAPQKVVVLVSSRLCCPALALEGTERLVEAELFASGLTVVVLDGVAAGERERRIELGVIAEQQQAQAALRVVGGMGTVQVEMWVTGDSGRPIFRRVVVEPQAGVELGQLVATRVVELMRAKLESPAAPPPVALDPPSHDVAWRLSADGRTWVGPGGLGALAGGGVGVARQSIGDLAIAADLALLRGLEDARAGILRATLWAAAARIWGEWSVVSWSALDVSAALGAGLLVLEARASPGREARAYGAYVGSRFGLAARTPVSGLRLRLNVGVGTVVPQMELRLAGHPVASFGALMLEGGVGAVLDL